MGEFGGIDKVGGDSVGRIAGGVPTCRDGEEGMEIEEGIEMVEGIDRFVASCRDSVGGEEPAGWKMC